MWLCEFLERSETLTNGKALRLCHNLKLQRERYLRISLIKELRVSRILKLSGSHRGAGDICVKSMCSNGDMLQAKFMWEYGELVSAKSGWKNWLWSLALWQSRNEKTTSEDFVIMKFMIVEWVWFVAMLQTQESNRKTHRTQIPKLTGLLKSRRFQKDLQGWHGLLLHPSLTCLALLTLVYFS